MFGWYSIQEEPSTVRSTLSSGTTVMEFTGLVRMDPFGVARLVRVVRVARVTSCKGKMQKETEEDDVL